MTARRLEEGRPNDEASCQVEKVLQDGKGIQGAQVPPQGDHSPNVERGNEVPIMSKREIRDTLLAIAQVVTTQINLSMVLKVNVMEITMTSRLRDFVRLNPLIFLVSKVE